MHRRPLRLPVPPVPGPPLIQGLVAFAVGACELPRHLDELVHGYTGDLDGGCGATLVVEDDESLTDTLEQLALGSYSLASPAVPFLRPASTSAFSSARCSPALPSSMVRRPFTRGHISLSCRGGGHRSEPLC